MVVGRYGGVGRLRKLGILFDFWQDMVNKIKSQLSGWQEGVTHKGHVTPFLFGAVGERSKPVDSKSTKSIQTSWVQIPSASVSPKYL